MRFFNKDYTFYTKDLFFTTKDAQNFVKISGLVTYLHFVKSVIHQNFKYNLRILAIFSVNTQTFKEFAFAFSKNYFFLDFLIKIILFTLKIYFFTVKDAQSFVKISFLVTFLHF